jgi:hypothetical protein
MPCTRRNFFRFSAAILVLPLIPSLFAVECGTSWSFGVIPDTQWKDNMNAPFYGTAIHIIDAINAEMVRQKVDFVIAVGDLVEKPSALAFQTRAAHNKALDEVGIKFYPVRGNHDAKDLAAVAQFKAVFPNLPGTAGSYPNLPGASGLTYSFNHKGGKFFLLDTFLMDDGSSKGKTYTVGDYLPWVEWELKKDDHHFALVFTHKNLRGQYHMDNVFGRENDSNPEMQNAFIGCLQQHGVRYFLSGHEHMYSRLRVKSPDGNSEVMQITCGSAAYKTLLPNLSFLTREKPIALEVNRIGFMIVHVEERGLRFEYYSTKLFGNKPKTPTWDLRDSFGYTWDGQEFGIHGTKPNMPKAYSESLWNDIRRPFSRH